MSDNKEKDSKQKPASPSKEAAPGTGAAALTGGAVKKPGMEPPKAPAKPAAIKPAAPGASPRPGAPDKPDVRIPGAKRLLKDEFPPDDDEVEAEEDDEEEEGFSEDAEADEEDVVLDPAVVGSTDTSERIILVVDEEGQRRNETVSIITQILPNAVIEVANDPEEALDMMEEGDFDTFVVNFLMPGYSSSPFVKSVANHPEHPLLIGFAADKMSDAVDPKKGLKIIPLKRLFDLDTSTTDTAAEGEVAEE